MGGITISPVKFVDEEAPKKWWFWLISELERACRCSGSLHRRSLCPLATALRRLSALLPCSPLLALPCCCSGPAVGLVIAFCIVILFFVWRGWKQWKLNKARTAAYEDASRGALRCAALLAVHAICTGLAQLQRPGHECPAAAELTAHPMLSSASQEQAKQQEEAEKGEAVAAAPAGLTAGVGAPPLPGGLPADGPPLPPGGRPGQIELAGGWGRDTAMAQSGFSCR